MNVHSQPGKGTSISVDLPCIETSQPSDVVHDPVCSALVKPHQAYGSVQYENEWYYFCCPVCQGAFQKNPTLYLECTEQPVLEN